MKKKVSIEEAVGKAVKEANVDFELSVECKVGNPTPDYEFKYVLGKALREEKVILMAKPDKYRGVGKTTMITSAFYMKEDAMLVVSTRERAQMYYPHISKDRILIARESKNGFKGRRVNGGFILDEITYQDYQDLKNILYPMGKVMGIVSIYKDYEIL